MEPDFLRIEGRGLTLVDLACVSVNLRKCGLKIVSREVKKRRIEKRKPANAENSVNRGVLDD